MTGRRVVIVGYDGVQPLDVVGPHEVFHGASRAAATAGPGAAGDGYRLELVSSGGGPVHAESGLELGTAALPEPPGRIDTLLLPGGAGVRQGSSDAN